MLRLVAHRGQRHTIPENTIESIRSAIDCGAMAVEFDVQMTADGVPVLSHDLSLLETAGIDVNLSEITYDAVKKISVNESARFANQYQDITLPSLQDIVAVLKDTPEVMVFVELKEASIEIFGIKRFLNAVITQIEPIQKQCVMISDSLQTLVASKKMASIPIGWIFHKWDISILEHARQSKVDYMVVNHKYCEGVNHDYAADDWEWMMYETRDPDRAVALFDQGVRFIESDDVCSMLKLLSDDK